MFVTLEGSNSQAYVKVCPVVGECIPLQHAHVQQLVSLLLFFAPFSFSLDVHVELGLLFCHQILAFVCPMIRFAAVVAVRVSCSIDLSCPSPAHLVTRSCCCRACIYRACVRSLACWCASSCSASPASAPASSPSSLDERETALGPVSLVWPTCLGWLVVFKDAHGLLECVGVLICPQQIIIGQLIF